MLTAMNTTHTSSAASSYAPLRVVLAAGDIMRLTPAHLPLMVTCVRGTCWLTQEGDALDHLLGAGMTHQVTKRGLTLIQAFSECVVELPSDAVRGSRRSTAA
jgi:Protein of unknown function (DUF2917)